MQPKFAAEAIAEPRIHLQESRRALRQSARRVTLTGTADDTRQFQATLHDLSRRGLRIRMGAGIHCGQFVRLEAGPEADIGAIECRVIRIQAVEMEGRELFEYGLQIADTSRGQGHRWFLYFCYGSMPRSQEV